MGTYAFLAPEDPSPPTVPPSLWRLARLNNMNGLNEVVPGVHQVRDYDLSTSRLSMKRVAGRPRDLVGLDDLHAAQPPPA